MQRLFEVEGLCQHAPGAVWPVHPDMLIAPAGARDGRRPAAHGEGMRSAEIPQIARVTDEARRQDVGDAHDVPGLLVPLGERAQVGLDFRDRPVEEPHALDRPPKIADQHAVAGQCGSLVREPTREFPPQTQRDVSNPLEDLRAITHQRAAQVYTRELPPPHFRVRATDVTANSSIETRSLLGGTIAARHTRVVAKFWSTGGRETLLALWIEIHGA